MIMNKIEYNNVDLTCSFQQVEGVDKDLCLHGVMSRQDGRFVFEEAVKCNKDRRNPKIFEGQYCSLVHMRNNKYQIHMKTIDATKVVDASKLAFGVYNELLQAFNILK